MNPLEMLCRLLIRKYANVWLTVTKYRRAISVGALRTALSDIFITSMSDEALSTAVL